MNNFYRQIYFKNLILLILTIVMVPAIVNAETVDALRNSYGTVGTTWNSSSGTLTFTSSASINFSSKGTKSFIWNVPDSVKTIIINANVTVNGAFHFDHNLTITGVNRDTSVLFGTDQTSWASANNVSAWEYSTINAGGGTVYIKNLKFYNPYAFHIRGVGAVCHVSNCDFIDDRGGGGNHSDGFVGGDGSTIDNCYFETGDDVIKLYYDLTCSNTTIKMVRNSVPIQLGWDDNAGDATGSFTNLTITGDDGRDPDDNAIIAGVAGSYTKTIKITGCDIQNPYASWVSLRQSGISVAGSVTDAYIDINNYWGGYTNGTSLMTICGSSEKTNFYECGDSSDDDSNDLTGDSTVYITNKKTQKKLRVKADEQNAVVQAPADWNGEWVQWQVVETDGDYFRLQHVATGLYLSMPTTADHDDIYARSLTTESEEWTQVDMGNGYFLLENLASGKRIRSRSLDDMDTGTNYGIEVGPINWTGDWVQFEFSTP